MVSEISKYINILTPKQSPFNLIKLGGDGDGAYLVPDDLDGIKACFSPGVNNCKKFEDELLDVYGILSHMCDYTSDVKMLQTPLKQGQTFLKKWLDIDAGIDSISLENWVQKYSPNSNDDLILQMDIEGAEYRNLINTPLDVLKRFRIIVIELHELNMFNQNDKIYTNLAPLLTIIDKHFICVHAHPNNCCGDEIIYGTSHNIPRVHELTFLRRDRFASETIQDLPTSSTPHPLDISYNVAMNPPLFLNDHWHNPYTRQPESLIKMLIDKNLYLTRVINNSHNDSLSEFSELINYMHKVTKKISDSLPLVNLKNEIDTIIDLAKGCSFKLSSRHAASPNSSIVNENSPFFFHTNKGKFEFITIDLSRSCLLFELHIKNRTDHCKDRARNLYYVIHDDPIPDFSTALPVCIENEFLTSNSYVSKTNLRGCAARYLTIFSPENTCLHFSNIQIHGYFDL